jgi:uncharacterized protein
MPGTRIEAAELREMAGSGARLTVRPGRADLGRLAKLLAAEDDDGGRIEIDASIRIDAGSEGYPQLTLEIDGRLGLRCQRCLRAVAYPLRVRSRLTVLPADILARQLAQPFDAIVMEDDRLDLEKVVEDEILSALPMAPAHEPGAKCEQAVPDAIIETEAEQTHRPFAELAALVGGREGGKGE